MQSLRPDCNDATATATLAFNLHLFPFLRCTVSNGACCTYETNSAFEENVRNDSHLAIMMMRDMNESICLRQYDNEVIRFLSMTLFLMNAHWFVELCSLSLNNTAFDLILRTIKYRELVNYIVFVNVKCIWFLI